LAMSLKTPDKIRSLQRKLYCKAKAEPAFRFYLLYDKIYREDVLFHAYRLARANAGAPGVDGMTFAQIEDEGLEAWLAGLREELVLKTYRPDPVRRVMIPKANGDGERPLGIPTIRDRVVQTAAKIVLEPIFEADLEVPNAGRWTQSEKYTGIFVRGTPISSTLIYRGISIRSHTRSFLNRWLAAWWIKTCCASSRCGSRRRSKNAMTMEPGA
jgi:RNA-directed DNA polymerase